MIPNTVVNKKLFDRSGLVFLFLFPFLISCSSNQNTVVEIINPPKFPEEFSSIPDRTDDPQLMSLLSADDKIKEIRFGRKDPFLPPQLEDEQLSVPPSFKYQGLISSGELVNAFVSYNDRNGTLKLGDIGGESTDLLPKGWALLNLDIYSKVLTLGFENQSIEVDLFSVD